MNTAASFLLLITAFTAAALLVRAASRAGAPRFRLDRLRGAAPPSGRPFGEHDDTDAARIRHDVDAIRTRFEQHPYQSRSHVLGERP